MNEQVPYDAIRSPNFCAPTATDTYGCVDWFQYPVFEVRVATEKAPQHEGAFSVPPPWAIHRAWRLSGTDQASVNRRH